MKICNIAGCGNPARWQVAGKIWAIATRPAARTSKNCARMLTGLCVCDEHRAEAGKINLFGEAGSRGRMYDAFRQAGGAMPDLDAAEVECVALGDGPTMLDHSLAAARRRGDPILEA